MLDKDGSVKIADYAMREIIHGLNPSYNYLPLRYLAPETIFNKIHTEASAVYSLGILAVAFCKGEQPFSEKDPHQINKERNNFLKNFTNLGLPNFLKKMLAYKADDRPNLTKCAEFFLRMQMK